MILENFPHHSLDSARERRKIHEPRFQRARDVLVPPTGRRPLQIPVIPPPPWSPSHRDYGIDLSSYGVTASDYVLYLYPQTRPQQHTIPQARSPGPQQRDLGPTYPANPHSYGAASSRSSFVRAFEQRNSNSVDDADIHMAARTPHNATRSGQIQPSAPPPVRRSVEDSSTSQIRSDGCGPLSRPNRQ